MKALIKLLVIPTIAALAFVGCGDDGGNNRNVNPYGLPNGFTAFPGVNGIEYIGSVSFQNGGQGVYQQLLEESFRCSRDAGPFGWGNWNTCKRIDGNPLIALNFNNTEYSDFWGYYGQLRLNIVTDPVWGSPGIGGQDAKTVSFTRIRSDEQTETAVQMNTGVLRIVMTGTPSDGQINLELFYRDQQIGTAVLTRHVPQFGNPYGNQFGNPYGNQFGNPYGNQYGNPYGNQYGNPYGQPNPGFPYGR